MSIYISIYMAVDGNISSISLTEAEAADQPKQPPCVSRPSFGPNQASIGQVGVMVLDYLYLDSSTQMCLRSPGGVGGGVSSGLFFCGDGSGLCGRGPF